jgi:flagellar hook protein FlgE
MLYAHRQQLLLEIKIKEQEEIVKNRAELSTKRQGIREEIPYTSWAKCLQHKAAQGNEVALAILRSKKVEVAPETGDKFDTNSSQSPHKTYEEISLESLNRQQKILDMKQVTSMQKKALISVEKMREILEKERLFDKNITALKNYRIDTKGLVLFTFDNGSSIRDTGKEIHFTPHDEQIRKIALQFSRQKWGGKFVMTDDMIVFDGSTQRKNISR